MAVVFISPKQRQRMFFIGITVVFLLVLVTIALLVFLSQPESVAPEMVFNKPNIAIDFRVLDSDQFKKLESFEEMQIQFSYIATTDKGEIKTGTVEASTKEIAQKTLEAQGYMVTQIQEVEVGRVNPFVPYYTVKPLTP
jgi:hypothetical protein